MHAHTHTSHAHTCIHTHTYTHAHTLACSIACTHARTHTCMHICVHTHTHMYTYINTHTHMHAGTHTHTHTHTHPHTHTHRVIMATSTSLNKHTSAGARTQSRWLSSLGKEMGFQRRSERLNGVFLLDAGVYVCTFQPGSFTGWGSEGVKSLSNQAP